MSVGLKQTITVQGIVTFNEPANAAAGSVLTGNLQLLGPDTPATTSQPVPINEVWNIKDIYSAGVVSGGADASLTLVVNGISQPLGFTVSTIDINKLSRFKLDKSIPILPGSTVQIKATLLGAVGASAVTQTVYVTIERVPVA
jgi:hypothetical protein